MSPEREGFNPSRWSIEHPYIILSFYLAMLLLAGVTVGKMMPRRLMPYVQSPMIGVVSMMPGLSAQEMETYISKPIEERMLVSVSGVRYVRSTSQDGFSIVTLEFPYGTDMDRALVNVQALLNVIQADLPLTGANLKPSWVLAIDPLNLPVLTLSLRGDAGWSLPALRELADNQVVNRIKSASPDIYAVSAFGGYRRQLQVIADRQKLAAYGVSILELRDALDKNNVARPAGTLTEGDRESIVRLDTLARDAQTVRDYPIKAVGDRLVYVRDVARVEDTYAERRSGYRHYARGQSHPGIAINILQNPSAGSPEVIAAVKAEVSRLEADYPGIHFDLAYDNSNFVGILMRNMFEELGVAVLLTGLVVLLFLGEWRGTLISLITIPTSLAMAILALVPLGMTLNSSTLIGLLLSIGRLVDDSIIDIHSIERHMRMGKDPKTATVDGITEVRLAVAASTLMLVLALTPLLFCGGIVQVMFMGLVWPIIAGLLASFLVSLTLTALLGAYLLKPPAERATEEKLWLYRWVLLPTQRGLDRLEEGYRRLIVWMLRNRFANLARISATLIVGFGFYYFIGSEMMPLADVGQGYLVLEMQPGTSYAATERAVEAVERIMKGYPELEHASFEIGAEPMTLPYFNGYSSGISNGATAMLSFSDKDGRPRTIWQIMDGIQAEAIRTIPGIRRLQLKEMGSDVMASSAAPVQLLVYGKDLAILSRLAEQVADIARKLPGCYQVGTSWSMSNPSYQLVVDPRQAAEVGLTVQDVADQAYYSLRGGLTNEFYRLPNLRQTNILVRYEEGQRRPTPQDLALLMVATPRAGEVPLSRLARFEPVSAPSLIEHDGTRRVVSVTAYYRMGGPASMDLSMGIQMQAMAQLNWPPGYGIEVRGDMTQMMDSFARLLRGLEFAMLFILLVLVAQFRGFLQPLQMIFSLPLELSGVFIALWLAHQAFSTVSIMGIIVLTGMDVTTAILLIDQILRFRAQGMPRNQAVIQACPTRLRPILMTSIITLIVMLPVALSPKTGMDAYSPLGTVVVGGLLMGTILSLLDIPIMHTLVDDLTRWLQVHVLRRDPASLPPIE